LKIILVRASLKTYQGMPDAKNCVYIVKPILSKSKPVILT